MGKSAEGEKAKGKNGMAQARLRRRSFFAEVGAVDWADTPRSNLERFLHRYEHLYHVSRPHDIPFSSGTIVGWAIVIQQDECFMDPPWRRGDECTLEKPMEFRDGTIFGGTSLGGTILDGTIVSLAAAGRNPWFPKGTRASCAYSIESS